SGQEQGTVLFMNAEEGTMLKRGDTVAVIDTMLLHLTKVQLQSSMKSVERNRPDIPKQIASLQKQIAKQLTERSRILKLLAGNAATTKQLDDVNSEIAVLESQLTAQRSSLENNYSGLDAQSEALAAEIAQINDRISRCVVVAPVDGTILARYIEVGELCTPGKPMFKIADMSDIFLRAYLTSGQLSDLKLGDQVNVTADFGGELHRKYKGRISWISDESEFTPKSIQTKDDRENLVYAVKVAVRNDGYIKLGMYGELQFINVAE
ncbi:MAG: HlyD family efflux transporter periplasmic adaptor subunit, partial [Bacteroidales bacterium]